MSGAYTHLDRLVALAGAARRLDLPVRTRTGAPRAGGHLTRAPGAGMDFMEYRNYQAGDDIRTIDWRASARTGTTQTRLYQQEKERPALFILDQGPSLFFGSRHNFKSVTAAEVMAILAWQALLRGDRVGALLLGQVDGSTHTMNVRPHGSRQHLLQLLQQAVTLNNSLRAGLPGDGQALPQLLGRAVHLARPGTRVTVISDFYQLNPTGLSSLARVARRCPVTAVQPFDPLEHQLPPAAVYAVSNGHRRGLLDTRSHQLAQRYSRAACQRQDLLAQQLASHCIRLHRIDCSLETESQLADCIRRAGKI